MMEPAILVATRKGLFEYVDDGGGWRITRRSFIGDNCVLTMRDPRDGATYAALNHGHFGQKLHRSEDGGRTWNEIACPTYPEPPKGYEPEQPTEGEPAPWRLKLIWAMTPGGSDQPGRIWCGTLPGGLFVSDDRGDSWRLVDGLWRTRQREKWFGGGADEPGLHSVCVDPTDSSRISIAVSCGGVWHSEEDGDSWTLSAKGMRAEYLPPELAHDENLQDPHCMVQCTAEPGRCWVQHHNGIFRSDDGGRTWTEVERVLPSDFGFAVAVHPYDPDTAWFVPGVNDEKRIPVDGALCVTKTRDGGATFEQLRTGLPQEDCWDIVYRHALDVGPAGRLLAMGSTTGNLWHSEDGGTRWAGLSSTLPPIYCVRIVEALP